MSDRTIVFVVGGVALIVLVGVGLYAATSATSVVSGGGHGWDAADRAAIESLRAEVADLRAQLASISRPVPVQPETATLPSDDSVAVSDIAERDPDIDSTDGPAMEAFALEEALFGTDGLFAHGLGSDARERFSQFLKDDEERRRQKAQEEAKTARERELDRVSEALKLTDAQRSGLGEIFGHYDASNGEITAQARAFLREGGTMTPEFAENLERLRQSRQSASLERDQALRQLLGDAGMKAYRDYGRQSAQRRNALTQFLRGGNARPKQPQKVAPAVKRDPRPDRASRKEGNPR